MLSSSTILLPRYRVERRQNRDVPCLHGRGDGLRSVALVESQPPVHLGSSRGGGIGCEELLDPGQARGLPPTTGAKTGPERDARLGDLGTDPWCQVIPDASHDGEANRSDLVDRGLNGLRLRCN